MYDRAIKFVDDFFNGYTNYKPTWNYEDGCVLKGAADLYDATGDKKYADFVIRYLEQCVNEEGIITNYENTAHSIDSINAGKVLYFAYSYTGAEKYRKAIQFVYDSLMEQPRNKAGNFWHKDIYPNQVWLDGLYMAMPFYIAYETKFNGRKNYNDILSQYENVRKILFDKEKELYYHAYDEARLQPWADKVTGLSKNFWLRSEGWLLMSFADTASEMDHQIYEGYRRLADLLKEGVNGILKYKDPETSLFYQLTAKKDYPGNYLETSGSEMIAYAILKGVRLGLLLPEKYLPVGIEIAEALINEKIVDASSTDERNILKEKCEANNVNYVSSTNLVLKDICMVAGLGPGEKRDGTESYYLSEPIVSNDSKGVGPFMMMLAELIKASSNK